MSKLILFLPLLYIAGATAIEWKNLHLTFGVLDGVFSIPLTKTEALKKDYSLMVSDSDLNLGFYAYKKDPRVSIGYDSYGNIAGVRISYIKADIPKTATKNGLSFNFSYYDNDAMYSSATYFDTDVYYNTILFSDPATLAAGGRTSKATTVGDNVYIKLKGTWTAMPKNECDAPSQNFTNAACFPAMGKHYFYKVSTTMDCMDFNGLFMMYEGGELIGLGFTVFGSHTSASTRTWYESPTSTVYKLMIPNNRPACVTEWVDNLGTTSLHIFFKKHPRMTFCLGRATKC